MAKILFHLAGGIGNMIMATPSVNALVDAGETVDLLVDGDFDDSIDLFKEWPVPRVIANQEDDLPDGSYDFYLISWLAKKPLDIPQIQESIILSTSYYGVDGRRFPEYEMYMHFARAINQTCARIAKTYCGTSGREFPEITKKTLVLYPGCQERYPIKRWDKFSELAARYDDVAIVGSDLDLSPRYSYTYPEWIKRHFGPQLGRNGRVARLLKIFGTPYNHKVIASTHVKNYIGKLTLADTAALISQAGAFVGNDGGLSHVAAALEVPTYVLFGPTDVEKNTVPMQNLHVIRTGLDCQPCQFGGKYPRAFTSHYIGCPVRMRCMSRLSVERVEATVEFG
jgi:hypothetical protein